MFRSGRQRRLLRGYLTFRTNCFILELLGKRDAAQCVSPSHGLAQRGELVTRRHRVVTVPQMLWYVSLVFARPLLNKAVNVRWFLVDASCEALLKAFCVSSELILASVGFQLWREDVVPAIDHFHVNHFSRK